MVSRQAPASPKASSKQYGTECFGPASPAESQGSCSCSSNVLSALRLVVAEGRKGGAEGKALSAFARSDEGRVGRNWPLCPPAVTLRSSETWWPPRQSVTLRHFPTQSRGGCCCCCATSPPRNLAPHCLETQCRPRNTAPVPADEPKTSGVFFPGESPTPATGHSDAHKRWLSCYLLSSLANPGPKDRIAKQKTKSYRRDEVALPHPPFLHFVSSVPAGSCPYIQSSLFPHA